ncbi:type IV pilus secretin PilQ [Cupriavidus sp. Marseille-Q8015]
MKTRRWRSMLGPATALAPMLVAPLAAWAQGNFVKQLDVSTAGEQTIMTIDLQSAPAGKPLDFMTEQPARIAIDFDATTFAAGRARYDYGGTLLKGADVIQTGERTRVVLDLARAVSYRTEVRGNQFVIVLDPARGHASMAAHEPALRASGHGGERLSLNFQNIGVRALLQVFGDFTNLNIITSDAVQGNLTLRLKDVPWDQALDIVLEAKGLASRRQGNVIWVAPRAELAEKEKLEMEARLQVGDMEPLRSAVIALNYQRAEEVRAMLLGSGGAGAARGGAGASPRMLSRRGSLTADVRTNQLFISDVAGKIEEIRSFIGRIDVAVRQVLIEARIVEATDSFSRSLGVRLGFASRTQGANYGSQYANVVPGRDGGGVIENVPALSLPAAALNGVAPASLAFSLFNANASRFLALELSALEADGKGKIISSPRVVTADNIQALIEQGTELPYQSATSSGATAVQFKKANLKLEVTPRITPEGKVILDVDVNKDSRGIATASGFAIDTKHVRTQVLVENGGTVMIGGIYTEEEATQQNKVPLLGDVPVLGALFRDTTRNKDRKELLVFLTPKVHADSLASASAPAR